MSVYTYRDVNVCRYRYRYFLCIYSHIIQREEGFRETSLWSEALPFLQWELGEILSRKERRRKQSGRFYSAPPTAGLLLLSPTCSTSCQYISSHIERDKEQEKRRTYSGSLFLLLSERWETSLSLYRFMCTFLLVDRSVCVWSMLSRGDNIDVQCMQTCSSRILRTSSFLRLLFIASLVFFLL